MPNEPIPNTEPTPKVTDKAARRNCAVMADAWVAEDYAVANDILKQECNRRIAKAFAEFEDSDE